jgi:hypothetical protein
MIVIGDSHVRAFAKKREISPIFIGPGKEYNFTSQHSAENLLKAILKLKDIIQGETVILFFGEPDTRFALGKGWHPWNFQEVNDDIDNNPFVLNCAKRYVYIISILINQIDAQFNILLPIYTTNFNQCRYIDLFNNYIQQKKICNVIDINSEVSKNGVLNKFYQQDIVHSNHEIVKLVLKKTKNKNNNKNKPYALNVSQLKFNKKFGCYLLPNKSNLRKYFEQIVNILYRKS